MRTLVTFLQSLILSGAIVYTTYGLLCLVAHCVRWTVRSIRRLADGARNFHASRAGGIAAISCGAGSDPEKRVLAAVMQPLLFPDIENSVREAREALFAYERWMFYAQSDIRETAARTRETIAQTRVLMARVDAGAAGVCRGNTCARL